MGIAAVIVKVMPSSLNVDFNSVRKKAKKNLEAEGAKNISFEEREIGFGLKALMIKMAWPEEKETELIVEKLKMIKEISEVDIEDYRRAFG